VSKGRKKVRVSSFNLCSTNLANYFGKMGGDGSGRYAWSMRCRVEDTLILSMKDLKEIGILPPKTGQLGEIIWRNTITGELDASVGYRLFWDNQQDGWVIVLRYTVTELRTGQKVGHEYHINLETSYPNYGGTRYWFTCPVCGKRAAKLYLPPVKAEFACRECHSLSYQCQREESWMRAKRRGEKIKGRLRERVEKRGMLNCKPKYMHERTYLRLIYQASEWQALSITRLVRSIK